MRHQQLRDWGWAPGTREEIRSKTLRSWVGGSDGRLGKGVDRVMGGDDKRHELRAA